MDIQCLFIGFLRFLGPLLSLIYGCFLPISLKTFHYLIITLVHLHKIVQKQVKKMEGTHAFSI